MNAIMKKQGYKYTEEFGYIPKDWGVSKLGKYIKVQGGYSFNSENFRKSGVPVIRISNILGDDVIIGDDTVYYEPFNIREEYIIENEDILIAMSGATTGKVGVYRYENLAYQNQRVGRFVSISNDMVMTYLKQFLKFNTFINELNKSLAQGAQPNISSKQIEKISITVPNKKEQEKIAEVLGDVDELIENTQQLIEKKKNLKIAAMQKLLTPKKDWETKELGSIGFMTAGGTPATNVPKYWNGDINWLQSGAVQNNIIYYGEDLVKKITSSGLKNSAAYLIKKDSVLIALTGATCANIGYLTFPSAANQSVVSLEPYQYNPYFLYQKLLMERNGILSLRGGSAQGGVTLKNLQKYKICIPTDIKIQNKIAAVLFDMDKEIETLEQELAKYKDLKFGMMQELLTGKVRLI